LPAKINGFFISPNHATSDDFITVWYCHTNMWCNRASSSSLYHFWGYEFL